MTMQNSCDISAVLSMLASDDGFRERLLGDPVAAASELGFKLDPADVPAVRSLPSKLTLSADQSALQSKLETVNSMVIFLLSGNDV